MKCFGVVCATACALLWVPHVGLATQSPSQTLGPISIDARAFETVQDFSYVKAQGNVVARYGRQTARAQELVFEKDADPLWTLTAHTDVQLDDPSFKATAQHIMLQLKREENDYQPQSATLSDIVVVFESEALTLGAAQGELTFFDSNLTQITLKGNVTVDGKDFLLSANTLTLMFQDETRWQIIAHTNVSFEGANQNIQGGWLELMLDFSESEAARLERATLQGYFGEGDFVNQAGERHDIRYAGETATLVFEHNALTRLDLLGAQLTTCTCAASIEKASYSMSGREITLWPDEWVLGRDLFLKISGVRVFWLPVFFAPLQDIDLDQFDYFPTIGRDIQRGWFAQWRLPVFVDPQNRGTVSLDYFNRYSETGIGLDWHYGLPTQSQSGQFSVYHLVGHNEVLDLNWRHRLQLPSVADLDWSVSKRDVRPASHAPSHLAYHFNAIGRLSNLQWQVRSSREEVSQEDQNEQEPPRFQVLERLPELNLAYQLDPGSLPINLNGQLSWGRFSEQREIDAAFTTSDRVDGAINASLIPQTVQSASLRLDSQAGVRYSWYGPLQQRTSTFLNLSAGWTPIRNFSAQAQYNVRSVQGQSPFAFDELQVSDVLSVQLNATVFDVRATLHGNYHVQAQRLDPLTLSLSANLGELNLQSQWRTQAHSLELDSAHLQLGWNSEWGQLTVASAYSFSAQRFDDLIVRLHFEAIRIGARIDPNTLLIKRTNAELDLRIGAWSLDFNGEFDWQFQRFSALQVGVIHHFCKDCWQAGVYLSGQRIWLQVQISAFPALGLNYSPTDGELRFNEPVL